MSKKTPPPVVELSVTQMELLRAKWTAGTTDLIALLREAFGDETLELHMPQGRAVRKFIAGLNSSATATEESKSREKVTMLTESQKANIAAMLETEPPPSTREIVKTLWPDLKNITTIHMEYRLVFGYSRELNEEKVDIWDEPVEFRRYQPPATFNSVVGMTNKYVVNPANPGRALYDTTNMKKSHEQNLKAMFSYMKTNKFILQASQYDRRADRELFEETFVRQVHDKALDLIAEEVDTYVAIAAETCEVSKMERDIRKYERVINDYLDGDLDGEKRSNLSKPFVDALTALRVKWGESKKRLSSLIENVSGSRSKRMDAKDTGGEINLVELIRMWSEEEERKDLLILAQLEHAADEKEFNRMVTVEDAIARMAGMTREEAIGGL